MKKLFAIIIFLLLLTIFLLPLYIYEDALSNVNDFPEKPISIDLNDIDLKAQWFKHEHKATLENYSSITPFWFYKWLTMAVLNDYFHITSFDAYTNMSLMAGQVAIQHMRKPTTLKHNLRMLDWHILHISLTIYIQRNWSAGDILVKYNEINS